MLTALETFKTIMHQRRALVRRLHKAVIGDKRIRLDGNGMWAVLDKSGNPVEISRTRTAAVKALAQQVAQEDDEEPLEDRHEDHGGANPRKPRRAKEDQQYRSYKSGGRLDGKPLTPREDDSGPLIDGARTPRVRKRPRLL